jgi:hypothetical protein
VPKTTSSEGLSFAQKGGRGGRGSKSQGTITLNKEYWKDKTCFNCGEKGYASSSRTKVAIANDDDSASIVQSIKKLAKDTKNLRKASSNFRRQPNETWTCLALNQKKRICTFSLTMESSSCK